MRELLAILAIALLCSVSISPSAGQDTSVEDQIKKLEQNWAQALLNGDAASLDQYEAEDIVNTDPSGRVTDRTQDKKDLSSGDLKFQSVEPQRPEGPCVRQCRCGYGAQYREGYL